MARSVKKATPGKKVVTKKTVKKAASKKSVPAKSPAKKASAKKAMPGKAATKKFIVKKGSEKKAATKNFIVKKGSEKKAAAVKATPKNVPVKKAAIKPAKKAAIKPVKKAAIKKAVVKKAVPSKKELNEQTAKANGYSEMVEETSMAHEADHEENILNQNEGEVVNNSRDEENMAMTSHAIPAPVEKYARPADPYHGSKAPVKRKSNITPSGKKPLWNK